MIVRHMDLNANSLRLPAACAGRKNSIKDYENCARTTPTTTRLNRETTTTTKVTATRQSITWDTPVEN